MQRVAAGDDRRHRFHARALRDLREVRQHERHADRRQHRREAEGVAQRPVGDALHRPAIERGDRHRDQQHDQEDQGDRGQPERDQHQERDQRDEAADHEDVAMGEIDHADDAVDHGVADRDQPVDRAEHEAVDELLGEIIHGCHSVATTRRRPPGSPGRHIVPFSNRREPRAATVLAIIQRACTGLFSREVPLPRSRQAAVTLKPSGNRCSQPGRSVQQIPIRSPASRQTGSEGGQPQQAGRQTQKPRPGTVVRAA